MGEMKLESPVRSHLKPFTSSVICKTAGMCGGMQFWSKSIDSVFKNIVCVCVFQGTFSLIIEALHTDSNDDLSTGNGKSAFQNNVTHTCDAVM